MDESHQPADDKRSLARQFAEVRSLKNESLRREIIQKGRMDLLASEVLGYAVKPFHRQMMDFQSRAEKRCLQLAFRGCGKSTLLDITRCIFEILKDPNIRILITSNTQLQSEIFLREIKFHFQYNEKLREIFGDYVSEAKWDLREINVKPRTSFAKESTVTCVGVGGAVVSRHYDLILGDDLVDEENARTEMQREKVKTWFYKTLDPCLEPHGRMFVIGTRYHYLDLYGHMLENEYKDCSQVIKAIDEYGNTPWPEKFPLSWLEEKQKNSGTIIFNAQYQNDTKAMEGKVFKHEWFKFYEALPPNLFVWQGVDLAISQRERADYFVIMTIGVDEFGNVYVMDHLRDRLTFKQQTEAIIRKFEQYSPIRVGIESNAFQAAHVQNLKATTDVRAVPIFTEKDKFTRALKLSALFESGRVFLRKDMNELVEELLLFPGGQHDDLFDGLDFAITISSRGVRKRRTREPGLL